MDEPQEDTIRPSERTVEQRLAYVEDKLAQPVRLPWDTEFRLEATQKRLILGEVTDLLILASLFLLIRRVAKLEGVSVTAP